MATTVMEIKIEVPVRPSCVICGNPGTAERMVHVAHGDTYVHSGTGYHGVSVCISCWYKQSMGETTLTKHANANRQAQYVNKPDPDCEVELAVDGNQL